MPTEENKETVRRVIDELVNKGDLAGAVTMSTISLHMTSKDRRVLKSLLV